MAVPAHIRVTMSGVYGTASLPVEIWAWNFNILPTAGLTTVAQLTTAATTVKDKYGLNLQSLFGGNCVLTKVRVARIGTDRKVERGGGAEYLQGDWNGNEPGPSATVSGGLLPLQTAVCVSLETARPGPAGKGRFFLPWPQSMALGTDWRLSSANATSIATAARGFLAGVNTGLSTQAIVVGATSAITGKPATTSVVTAVKVGRVPDTMRSRRGELIEEYSRVAV